MTRREEAEAVRIIGELCAAGRPAKSIDVAILEQLPHLTEQDLAACWSSATTALAKTRNAPAV